MAFNQYNNSNNYSPYYQPVTGRDVRGKYPDQSGNTGGYQNGLYQPLSAYQTTSQQAQSSAPQSANTSAYTYDSQAYGNMNGMGTSKPQDTRPGYTAAGRQTDTTALGNLAYASTLGRDSNALPQSTNYNRTQDSPGSGSGSYGINTIVPSPYGAGHQRTDSRNSSNTPRENSSGRSTAASGTSYTAPRAESGHQLQQESNRSNWQTQAQYIAAQRPPAEQSRLTQYSSQRSQPTSSQAAQTPSSRVTAQAVHSPSVSAPQAPPQRASSTVYSSAHNRVQSPQQHTNRTIGTPTGVRGNTNSEMQSKQNATFSQPPPDTRQPVVTDTRVSGDTSQSSTSTVSQYPTTVDPSQVFNHAEYQRRQEAAAAAQEAAKDRAAQAAQAAKQPKPNLSKGKGNPMDSQLNRTPSAPGSNVPTNGGTDPKTAKKDQMELEMKQMIEKMRDYKSKDPSLFSQIWEQVKKGQPAQRVPSVSAVSPASPVVINDQIPSPNPANVQLPPESELPAADIDHRPAQPKKRGNEESTPLKKSHHKKKVPPAESTPNPANQTLQQAMTDFHKNSGTLMPQSKLYKAPPSASSASTPAVNGQTQPPKVGGTYWPENKKRALAEAARAALTSQDANKGKQISADEIHELLNQNPSYTQMCEILEYRGFAIDRSQFARLLLKAVPDLGSSAPSTAASAPLVSSAPSTSSAPTIQPPPPAPASQPPPHIVGSAPVNGYATPHPHLGAPRQPLQQSSHGIAPVAYHYANGFINPTSRSTASSVVENPSFPAPTQMTAPKGDVKKADQRDLNSNSPKLNQVSNKEQAAKKRSFADIVDLTALSDDDLEPPSQRPRLEDATSIVSKEHAAKGVFETIPHRSLQKDIATPKPIVDKPGVEDFKYKSSQRESQQAKNQELLHNKAIVRPLNKRQDALRRSSYNARTIARDILIAMGKHPTMYPLNGHLSSLRENFQAVDLDSDLSTIKWDLLDPGGESQPPKASRLGDDGYEANKEGTEPSQNRHRSRLFVGANTDTTSSRNPVQSVEGPRKRAQPSRGGFAGSASRSRIDAHGSSSQQRMLPPPPSTDSGGHSGHNFDQFVHNYIPSMETPFIGSSNAIPNSLSSHPKAPTTHSPRPNTSASGKRVGRPPGAKNKQPRPDKGIPKTPRDTPTKNTETGKTPTRTASSGSLAMPARPRVDTTPARPRVDTTPARPSSLRNAISPGSSATFAVVIPSRSPSITSTPHPGSYAGSQAESTAKSGRPERRHSLEPEYKVYICQWASCPAELHNLETLKKHVRKHRMQFGNGPYPCLWANCFDQDYDNKSDLAWIQHIEKKHLNPVAWELGDGPVTHSSDYDAENDSRSRQVTPQNRSIKHSSQFFTSPAARNVTNFQGSLSDGSKAQDDSPTQIGFKVVI